MAKYTLLPHQQQAVEFLRDKPGVYDASDAGTGKTFVHLTDWVNRFMLGQSTGLLILAAKSLLRSVWENEIHKFFPNRFSVAVITAQNRELLLTSPANILITNTDAVTWILTRGLQPRVNSIIIDESDAFRFYSQRTKALMKLRDKFKYRRCLSGTPFNHSIVEWYYQISFLDNYSHFGPSFYKFRDKVADARPMGITGFTTWQDKPDAEQLMAAHLQDMVIRYKLEDCVQLPPMTYRRIEFELPPELRKAYNNLKENALLAVGSDMIFAANAAILANKLLQLLSGSVYSLVEETVQRQVSKLHMLRYELALDLAKEVKHSLVFYIWDHQLAELIKEAKSRGISYEYINGSVPERRREAIVRAYQAGAYQTLFLHPRTAAHGLTLTRASRIIWASPIYAANLFIQGNRRINRIGQEQEMEVICIQAKNTLEDKVYDIQTTRLNKIMTMLELLC